MSELPLATDYAQLFLDDVPLIDVRAPIEFKEGAFPCSTNLPLMTDDERAQVGTCFKKQGQAAAIELGHKLVGEQYVPSDSKAGWRSCASSPMPCSTAFAAACARKPYNSGWLKRG